MSPLPTSPSPRSGTPQTDLTCGHRSPATEPGPSARRRYTALGALVAAGALLLPGTAALAAGSGSGATAGTTSTTGTTSTAGAARTAGVKYYTPPADPGAIAQIAALRRAHRNADAAAISAMVKTPQASWLTGGTPAQVRDQARKIVREAAEEHQVPVLVAYNLPFRDCSQYSSGGAANTTDYLAWIDGLAAGIGKQQAVLIVEPDGLGIIPFYQPLYGSMDWCQPKDAQGQPMPGANPTERFKAVNGAVDKLRALPGAKVYIDGTNSAWLSPGEITDRLMKAGVQRADGFFLNVSNYRTTEESNHYGGWISSCLTAVTNGAGWAIDHPGWCPSQYSGSSVDYSPAHVADVDAQYVGMLGGATPTTRYIVDTSRNGKGGNDMSAYAAAPYNQPADVVAGLKAANWCNPPGAGLGLRTTSNTGVALAAAYLWIKTPGQSDGSCDSAGSARPWDYSAYNPWGLTDPVKQSHFDPLWGMVDPAAGAWFPQQALELAHLAEPPLATKDH
ncbi:MAG TPA: glycoside hydrolase family 6 protein [Kineosporiaceae bacterium]|nr:glycoside hydrolase family 6 protein [Kineosporiaceae bacterium]